MNKKLSKKLKISEENQIKIKEIHNILRELINNPEDYDNPVDLIEYFEFKLQELWGFELSRYKHTWRTRIKGCSCPSVDNYELLGSSLYWSSSSCKWHNKRPVGRDMKIYAVVKTLSAGYDIEQEGMNKLGFEIGDSIEVERIEIDRSSSSVYLLGYEHGLNSVFFKFVNTKGEEIDILRSHYPQIRHMYVIIPIIKKKMPNIFEDMS